MKKLLVIAFLMLSTSLAFGQGANAVVLTGAGAPPASCAFIMFYIKSDGTFYACPAGSFSAVAGGGGGDTISSPNSTLNVGGTSSATTLDLKGAAGQIMAGVTPALTATPTLGANGGTGGSLTFAGSTSGSAAVTVSSTGVLALPSGTTSTNLTLTTPLLGTPTSGVITNLTGTCTACTANSATSVPAANIASGALVSGMTATTQAAKDNSTKLATTAYVDRATGLTTGTSVTLTAPRQYFICTSPCTITMPVPAAGYEFCVQNNVAVSTVITFAAIGSSSFYGKTDQSAYGTAGTGTLVSGGAVGDKMCLLGVDATHYNVASFNGTWVAN